MAVYRCSTCKMAFEYHPDYVREAGHCGHQCLHCSGDMFWDEPVPGDTPHPANILGPRSLSQFTPNEISKKSATSISSTLGGSLGEFGNGPRPANVRSVDLAVRLFLTAIGGGFCSQPIAEISNGGNNYKRYIFSFVVGFLFFLAGATWPSLKSRLNVGLANSLNQCANDARAWFVLISIAWIYSFAPGLILAIRGEPSFLSLASEVETMQKDMTRYVMPRHITPNDH